MFMFEILLRLFKRERRPANEGLLSLLVNFIKLLFVIDIETDVNYSSKSSKIKF